MANVEEEAEKRYYGQRNETYHHSKTCAGKKATEVDVADVPDDAKICARCLPKPEYDEAFFKRNWRALESGKNAWVCGKTAHKIPDCGNGVKTEVTVEDVAVDEYKWCDTCVRYNSEDDIRQLIASRRIDAARREPKRVAQRQRTVQKAAEKVARQVD